MLIDRKGSTLGVMDDLQIALHTYDGCARGCSGCIVDKHFKNDARGQSILSEEHMTLVDSRVREYYEWCKENLNTKETGYFKKGGMNIDHYSYTYRFGNHSELPMDELEMIAKTVDTQYRVFSTAPTPDIEQFYELQKRIDGNVYLEIIYEPRIDKAEDIRDMILNMREHGILGYPEVLVTKFLVDAFSPKDFVEKCVAPMGHIGTQMQFGRYTPSRTRNFSMTQVVAVDVEVNWLAEVSRLIIQGGYDIHPIPLGEYAVTLLDEYGESQAWQEGLIIQDKMPEPEPFRADIIRENTRDIFISSLYIDHMLDVYIWSESVGQHVLDSNFGFKPLGNLFDDSIINMVTRKNGELDKMLNQVLRQLVTHPKCSTCRYKSFCASHGIPLFRKFQDDNGEHCYGYLPVIREFQKSPEFLNNMIDGFKRLGF